ncbi:MAG: RidA family protein [Emcibacter sp.]|nr:RidA family protein [Emcibacter sp.]
MKRRSFFSTIGLGAFLASTIGISKSSVAYSTHSETGNIDRRLIELGIMLPDAPNPIAVYTTFRIVGNLVYIAGQGPLESDSHKTSGVVGKDLTTEQGYQAARLTGLNILAILKKACNGNLDRVVQAVQIQGVVQCSDDYHDSPFVINGASELFRDVFGDRGLAARAALGTNALPGNIACEILSIWEIRI